MAAPTTPDLPSLLAWAQTVEQRLGQLSNDGSGNAPLAPVRGCLATISGSRTAGGMTNSPNGAYIPFDLNVFDTDGIHNTASNNTRLTVPGGVSRVRVLSCISFNGVATTDWVISAIDKNRNGYLGQPAASPAAVGTAPRVNLVSTALQVSPGDYFELRLNTGATPSPLLNQNQTWFAMEILG